MKVFNILHGREPSRFERLYMKLFFPAIALAFVVLVVTHSYWAPERTPAEQAAMREARAERLAPIEPAMFSGLNVDEALTLAGKVRDMGYSCARPSGAQPVAAQTPTYVLYCENDRYAYQFESVGFGKWSMQAL